MVESQAQGPCFEKGLFLGHRPRIGGDAVLRTSLRPGYRLCLESPSGLGLVGKLCPGTPIFKTLARGLLCSQTTSGREG